VAEILPFEPTASASPSAAQINRTDTDAEWIGVMNALAGHAGKSVTQHFRIERRRELENKRLKLECREYLVTDQFTNLYVVFVADLIDEERHCVPTFVGSKTRGLKKKYAMFKTFSDEMLAHLQDEAWVIFGRQTVAIMRARQAANVPVIVSSSNVPTENLTVV
jgi:hypothetical protein